MPLLKMTGVPRIDRWGVYFAMLCSDGTTVQCTVTLGALDALAEREGETTAEQQTELFEAWRVEIEREAIAKFARGDLERDLVILRPEDFRQG
ncbi:MAG: DUF1488 family protein [Hyphomicrobiaceae bacterium]